MSRIRTFSQVTFTGKRIDVNRMNLDDVCIKDVAHHLSMICRFGGATQTHYSVAQHSLLVSHHLVMTGHTDLALWGLLHDAPEAYYGDIIIPLRWMISRGECHRTISHVDTVVFRRFGLLKVDEAYLGTPHQVQVSDVQVCDWEFDHFFGENPPTMDGFTFKLARRDITQPEIERAFLDRYCDIIEERSKTRGL